MNVSAFGTSDLWKVMNVLAFCTPDLCRLMNVSALGTSDLWKVMNVSALPPRAGDRGVLWKRSGRSLAMQGLCWGYAGSAGMEPKIS